MEVDPHAVEGTPAVTDEENWEPPGGPPPRFGERGSTPQGTPPPWGPPGADGAAPGPGPGWSPPPPPGLLPLHPLGFGALIGAPFRVLRRNPRASVGSALLIQGLSTLASLVIMGGVTAFALSRVARADAADVDTIRAGAVAAVIAAVLVSLLLSLLGSALLQGVIVAEVARGTLGEKLTLRRLWGCARGRFSALIAWTLLLAAAMVVGVGAVAALVAALVVSGPVGLVVGVLAGLFGAGGLLVLFVWLFVKTALVPSVLVLERARLGPAIARSWRLTRGSFWRTFGAIALVVVIMNGVSYVATLPFSIVFGIAVGLAEPGGGGGRSALVVGIVSYGLMLLVSIVVGSITAVVQSAISSVLYLDLRMRREGLDLVLQRHVEDRQAGRLTADPFPTGRPA